MAPWSWIYVYPLLLVLLFGIAIYEHVSATSLALPLSPALTVLAIILPILSFANTIAFPAALTATEGNNNQTLTRRRPLLVANLLQGLYLVQLFLAVVLATIFFGTAVPTSVRSCVLGTAWQHLFATKNAAALRRIQDALDCCGFNSVRDRAWPFAEDVGGGRRVACAERFGRSRACAAPWTATLQRTAGVDGGVAVGVLVLQLVLYLVVQWMNDRAQRPTRYQQPAEEGGWARLFLPFVAGGSAGDANDGVTRPLLGGGHVHGGNGGSHRARPPPLFSRGYVYEYNTDGEQDGNGNENENDEGLENNQNGEAVDEEQARPAIQDGQQPASHYGSIAPHDAWRAE